MNYFVTAIGTDSGKTLIASALALALDADYWKPIQAGYPTDSDTVRTLTAGKIQIHKESYVLRTPASPHYAAAVDNINIDSSNFKIPETQNSVVIEGAGGCLVPINNSEFVIDLAQEFKAEVILVSNNYLGSINHTLLTLDYLYNNNFNVKAIIFNGLTNESTEDIIMKNCKAPCFYKVAVLKEVNQATVEALAKEFKLRWNELGW